MNGGGSNLREKFSVVTGTAEEQKNYGEIGAGSSDRSSFNQLYFSKNNEMILDLVNIYDTFFCSGFNVYRVEFYY